MLTFFQANDAWTIPRNDNAFHQHGDHGHGQRRLEQHDTQRSRDDNAFHQYGEHGHGQRRLEQHDTQRREQRVYHFMEYQGPGIRRERRGPQHREQPVPHERRSENERKSPQETNL